MAARSEASRGSSHFQHMNFFLVRAVLAVRRASLSLSEGLHLRGTSSQSGVRGEFGEEDLALDQVAGVGRLAKEAAASARLRWDEDHFFVLTFLDLSPKPAGEIGKFLSWVVGFLRKLERVRVSSIMAAGSVWVSDSSSELWEVKVVVSSSESSSDSDDDFRMGCFSSDSSSVSSSQRRLLLETTMVAMGLSEEILGVSEADTGCSLEEEVVAALEEVLGESLTGEVMLTPEEVLEAVRRRMV